MQTSYRFSAPGRTEISGNHTDHQHGCVLAAAVDLETTAEVTLRPDPIIRVASEGYAPVEIDLNDLSVHEAAGLAEIDIFGILADLCDLDGGAFSVKKQFITDRADQDLECG